MFFPLIPIGAGILAGLGLMHSVWYWTLSKEERAKVDELAKRYAISLFRKGIDQLSKQELNDVYAHVKRRHFDGGQ